MGIIEPRPPNLPDRDRVFTELLDDATEVARFLYYDGAHDLIRYTDTHLGTC